MTLNILHLRYALEVEKTGSITSAADHLFVGQPNLSKAIKELESFIGITIFKRTSKGMIPTQKGAEFLNNARKVISKIDELDNMYSMGKVKKRFFNVSVPRASYVSLAFTRFLEGLDEGERLEVNFKETNSLEAVRNILENEYNLGIIRYHADYEKYFLNLLEAKNIHAHTLWEFDCVVVMSKHHPLAKKKKLTWEDLRGYTMLVHGDTAIPSVTHSEMQVPEMVENIDRKIYLYERGSQMDLLRSVSGTYMLVSPIPEELLKANGLILRKCSGLKGRYKDVIIYPKNYKLKRLDKEFIESLYSVKDALEKNTYS
ncbi:MAG: LysR family transcriptional regulator [Oscillospiraceae bacterium]|nr:LysR family transcriptional regulator [Oscillospiraceae bacterium]